MKYQIDTDNKTIQLLENTLTEKVIELLSQFQDYTLITVKQTFTTPLSNPLPIMPSSPMPKYPITDPYKITCSTI